MPRQRQIFDEQSTPEKITFRFDNYDPEEEEWEYYIQRFQIEITLHNITSEETRRNLLLSRIGAKPFKFLADHFRPQQLTSRSFDEIVRVLSAHYESSFSTLGERVVFGRRHRLEGESISQFVNTLRGLAGRCQFGASLDERLRDQLILGINNEEWQKELLRQHTDASCSFKDVEQTALMLERADKTLQTCKQVGSYNNNITQANVMRPSKSGTNQGTQLVRGRHCFRCGGSLHSSNANCPANGKTCNICHGQNHFAKVCFKSGRAHILQNKRITNNVKREVTRSSSSSSVASDPCSVYALKKGNKVMMTVLLNKIELHMLYDPGAAESVISYNIWKKIGSPSLQPTSNLVAYTGVPVKTLGKAMVSVSILGNQTLTLPVTVVKEEDLPLFGLSWVLAFNLPLPPGSRVCTLHDDLNTDAKVNPDIASLLSKYSEVFEDSLGKFKGQKAVIKLTDDAVPKVCKPRPIPYALRPAVEGEINRLLEKGVLESIDPTTTDITWASPIVVVVKSNGNVRICGDFKATINPFIAPVQHPLPKFEDIMTKLQGGEEFTKIDLKDAYLQIEVEDDSRKYLVISTPFGYFRYTRLPFGIRCAPGDFQRKIEQVLLGIPGVAQYLDDSIITGKTREEHLKNLEEVLARFKDSGVRIQKEKCKFLQKSVTYLGHKIDKSGIHPSDKHLEAVRKLPRPSNVKDLRAFLGAINYYQRFIPRLQCVASPLHRLLRKGETWNWTEQDESIFTQLKSTLTSSDTLVHYSESLPIVVDSDASNAGLGAVLSHEFPDGSIKPIAYASRVLHSSEKSYSVIDKEALGIIFAVTKFHDYIYGRNFTLRTDHKPLVHILGQHVELPRITSDRLTRWSVILGAYNFDIKYNEGKSNAPADLLSRLPVGKPSCSKASVEFGKQLLQLRLDDLHLTRKQLKEQTANDECLQQVGRYVQSGWPERKRLNSSCQIFYDKRDEMSFEDGVLLWKGRIIIPKTLQTTVLQILHAGHPGIVGMRSFARFHIWWPGMNSQIEEYVSSCNKCQQTRKKDPELPLFSWVVPQEPWTRVHIDFTGPYYGFYWLVIVDSTTKWLEVLPTKKITSDKTISMLEEIFTTFGLPATIVSDNGPQFTSHEFRRFCKRSNIRHVTTAPYHPRSNGLAERYIQTFKRRFEASKLEGDNVMKSLKTFLFNYRITPHSTTGKSPGELMFGRQLQTPISLLKPSHMKEDLLKRDVQQKVLKSLERQKRNHDKTSKWREFQPGDRVWVKLSIDKTWRKGRIVRRTGPVSYVVEEGGSENRRHADQLRKRHPN